MESEIEDLRETEAQLKREIADLKAEKDAVVRKFEDEITCVKVGVVMSQCLTENNVRHCYCQ